MSGWCGKKIQNVGIETGRFQWWKKYYYCSILLFLSNLKIINKKRAGKNTTVAIDPIIKLEFILLRHITCDGVHCIHNSKTWIPSSFKYASEQQDLHFLSHPDKCVNLIDIDLFLPISAIQSDHSWQHLRRSIHPMGIEIDNDSPLPPISATQGDHSR